MRAFSDINPIALFIYFICVSVVPMFSMDGFILAISFLASILLFILRNGRKDLKSHFMYLVFFVVMVLINPLVSHNGVTVLFVMNNKPITLESVIYGVFASTMIITVLYWFRTFSDIMTSDKLLYILGGFSKKLALIVSMTLRYIPLFKRQIKKINQTQKALGLYKEENIIDTIKGKTRVFSIMVTWTIENGIITAESMEARGYGLGKRTVYSNYKMTFSDIVFLIVSVVCVTITFLFVRYSSVVFYPAFEFKINEISYAAYISYAVIAFLPIIIEVKESLKWKYLELKI